MQVQFHQAQPLLRGQISRTHSQGHTDSQGSDRKDVSVWVSFDGAKTWPIKRCVFHGPSAYSSLNVGRLGTPSAGWAYIQLEGGKKHRYEGGHLARFNLNWLLGGTRTGDGQVPEWVK